MTRRLAPGPTLFVVASHAAAAAGAALYGVYHGFTWAAWAVGLAFLFLTTFSVSAGYHRLFSHGAYEARWLLRAALVFFGSAAFEGSVLNWASLHRRHHMASDTEDDPHDIGRGFFHAHIGWVVFGFPPSKVEPNLDDLRADPLLRLQDRYYAPLAVASGLLLPWAAGWALGDAWGGLVVGGFLRTVYFHHVTWLINSAAHTFGSRPYDPAITARDSAVLALLTMGEGYHNYHHAFPYDYRNGPRARNLDMTKWLVYLMSLVGLSRGLVRADQGAVDEAAARARGARPAGTGAGGGT